LRDDGFDAQCYIDLALAKVSKNITAAPVNAKAHHWSLATILSQFHLPPTLTTGIPKRPVFIFPRFRPVSIYL
jgi:hypothetical protein